MRSVVEYVIYFYLFICLTLLLFNVFYIARSTRVSRKRAARIGQWEKLLAGLTPGEPLPERLLARLKQIEQLMAFQAVLLQRAPDHPGEAQEVFRVNRNAFQNLALQYRKRPAMERAFFAYVVATFHPPVGDVHDQLAEILLGYLDDSTVFCRENVLHALYALGSGQALEHAFEILHQRGWYHNPKLISDGLVRFTGDKAALVRRLWENRQEWEECLTIGTVQFASSLPGGTFAEDFLAALDRETLTMEIRFALIRYFQRHFHAPAEEVLNRLLGAHAGEDGHLAVAAAAALASYPGEETRASLKRALHSRNWYVRRNAAQSLSRLGITPEDEAEIRAGGDRYAVDMLEYALELAAPAPPKQETREEATV